MATETVTDLAKKAISQREKSGEHPLDLASDARAANDNCTLEEQAADSWEHLP